ncbi:MAG: hypothetical protein ABMB14_38665, partial [Myxococcota bacterium]
MRFQLTVALTVAVGCAGDDDGDGPPPPDGVDDASGVVSGRPAEAFGLALAAVGDVDGDGVADLAA